MHLYGNLSPVASVGILVLFALYLGLYLGLFGLLFGTIRRNWNLTAALISSPILWLAVEFARDRVTGFPWDLLGYTQIDNLTLVRLAPWTGVFGLSLVIAAVNMLWAAPIAKLPRAATRLLLSFACTLTIIAIWLQFKGPTPPPAETTATAVLVQENLSVGVGAQQQSREAMLASFATLSQHPDFPPQTALTGVPKRIRR